jgi:beta-mannanase
VPTPSSDFLLGVFVEGAPSNISLITSLESKIDKKFSVINYFQTTSQGFTRTAATNAANHGSVPLITLEFWDPSRGVNQPAFSLKQISGGAHDNYLRTYARDAKAFGKTVWLRPLHEMNGNWYPWGGTVNGNNPSDFTSAWRHIVNIFREEGATNVKFMWCPNAESVPNTSANSISAYWPGDDYVDYLSIDGYNAGVSSTSAWRSFSSVFSASYAAVTKLSAKPVYIAEISCSPDGGNKATWISDMFRVLPTQFPRIKGVVWFNKNSSRDWRIESSSESLAAFKAAVSAL